MEIKSLDYLVSKGSGTVDYKEILTATDKSGSFHKLKIDIRSDQYARQSFAKVSRWDGERWNEVDNVPFSKMQTEINLSSKPDEISIHPRHFVRDRDELIRLCQLVFEITA